MSKAEYQTKQWLTLPNAITSARILGSPGLIFLAMGGQVVGLGILAVLLVFTEWLDGFLARRLRVTSAVGARLDTIADAVFYSCLLAAIVVLRPTLIADHMYWIVGAVVSYGLSWLASLVKFGRLPSYHTWAAKGVWMIVGVGVVCALAGLSQWPFKLAMVCVAATNLEAIAITLVIAECQVDVPSLWHATRRLSPPA